MPRRLPDLATSCIARLAGDARYRVDAHIAPKLGEIQCNRLTTLELQKWLRDLASSPARLRTKKDAKKWDGKRRIDTLVIDYLGCEDTPLNRAIGWLMLIASVHRARSPGCKFDQICVLEGPEGINKSKVIRVLAGDENFSDQSVLNVSDREAQEQLEGIWLHESADLTGLKKAEAEKVKAFASRQRDRARPAYGRVREDRPRRCTQWATTNDVAYLASQTGNRRFWPLPVSSIDVEALRRDRDQLWGEAATLEAKGASIMLDPALWLAAADEQEKRRIRDTWEDVIENIPPAVEVREELKEVQIIYQSDGKEMVPAQMCWSMSCACKPDTNTQITGEDWRGRWSGAAGKLVAPISWANSSVGIAGTPPRRRRRRSGRSGSKTSR